MSALDTKDFDEAEKLVYAVGDSGFEMDALKMGQMVNAAEKKETYTWEPVEQEEIPMLQPWEAEAPNLRKFSGSDTTTEWGENGTLETSRA